MSKEQTTQVVSSFPVLGLLGAVLVVLKVLGKITLAWKWVLAPFWIPALIGLGIAGVVLIILALAAAFAAFLD